MMEAFNDAYKWFYESLPPTEQRRYVRAVSPAELLAALEQVKTHAKQRQKKRISESISRIGKVVQNFEKYFKAVDIIIQAHPEYAALVWGAMRFLLQLASNFSAFYDKLIITLERLAAETSQYEGIELEVKIESNARLRNHLEKVYVQLFQFFHTAARVFLSNHKLKSTLSVLSDLVWKSFDDRFGDILERICSYRDLIKLELALVHVKASNNADKIAQEESRLARLERLQAEKARQQADEAAAMTAEVRGLVNQQRKDQLVHRITKWLSAPHFAEAPSHAQSLREDGTTRWIFDRAEFRKWKENEWCMRPGIDDTIVGEMYSGYTARNPGSGKTVLAASVLQEMQSQMSSSPHRTHEICYYFFGSETMEPSTSSDAYRALLTQIVHHYRNDADLLDKFSFALQNPCSTGSASASSGELEALFKLCFQYLPAYLILDGIDDCSDVSCLLQDLLWISSNTVTKVLLLGRANVLNMSRHIPQDYKFAMPQSALSKDIGVYLTSQMTDLVEEELLHGEVETEKLVDCLVQGADGMFLWATLMIKYLHSPALTPWERMQTIREVILPEGLDQMYRRISNLIIKSGKTQLHLARRIMTWALCCVEPLPIEVLHDALTYSNSRLQGHKYQDFRETISVICGGLLECYSPRENQNKESGLMVRYIHLSVKEHFLPGPFTTDPHHDLGLSLSSEPAAHLELAEQCMEYIRYFKPSMDNGKPVFGEVRPSRFAAYASRNWCQHITKAFAGKSIFIDGYQRESPEITKFEDTAISVLKTTAEFVEDSVALQCWIDMYFSHAEENRLIGNETRRLAFCTDLQRHLRTCPQAARLKKPLQDLVQILQDWDADILRLVKEWGTRLAKTPALVWNEVPAFLGSRYLRSSLNTRVMSLGHSPQKRPDSSSKALCTISRTAALNQNTAVLTIWPSRAYEESWEDIATYLCHYRKKEAEVSHGWVARYELWRHDDGRQKIMDTSIQLCATEVSLLLRQSSRIKNDDGWGLSFPLAIGAGLQSFVVLRTLYRCYSAEDGPLGCIQSVVIPMDCHKELRSRWVPTFQTLPGDWYSYKFSFGLDDRFPLFTEELRISKSCTLFGGTMGEMATSHAGRIHASVQSRLSTSVFEVEEKGVLTARLQSAIQNEVPVTSATFHPVQQCVAMSLGRSIEIWQFGSSKSSLGLLSRSNAFKSNRQNCGICRSWSVIPLPGDLRCDTSPSLGPKQIAWQQRNDEGRADSKILQSKIAPSMSLRPGQIIQGPALISTINDSSTSLLSSSSGTAVTVDLSSVRTQYQTSTSLFEITSLPEWAGIQHTSPAIIIPVKDRMSITVVLNKDAEDEYGLSNPPDTRLPLVITRDISAIQRLTPNSTLSLSETRHKAVQSGIMSEYNEPGATGKRKRA
ncbi:hypothetical protein OPT61_g7388 [Boeremia exigua]|uniref:Uncharacterized protein n=1 Tax=Boeremia exigua TaxID=749465 RepID=A0ACC2I2P7_9PLEO|nr:hypothetical protein OPT61_g7388 [Boeremia exigua]